MQNYTVEFLEKKRSQIRSNVGGPETRWTHPRIEVVRLAHQRKHAVWWMKLWNWLRGR